MPLDTHPETDVPDDEEPAGRCPYCDRPFRTHRLRDLHIGEQHPQAHTESEAEAYDRARETERDDLFTYHFKVIFGAGLVYIVLVMTLVVVL